MDGVYNGPWEPRHKAWRHVPEEAWVGDDAHAACKAWLSGWRSVRGSDGPPPAALAGPVGLAAVAMMREGTPRADLVILFGWAGREELVPGT